MSSPTKPISFSVNHRGTTHPFSLLPDTTLEALRLQLEELTSVPPSLQKLLQKGKRIDLSNGVVTLADAGFKDGAKLQLLGPTNRELGNLQAAETEQRKRERILRERASKATARLRSTGISDSSSLKYRFHQLAPLAHLPNPASAMTLLTKLSEDQAILHVMQKHEFSVGVLTELAPHEHPGLLGLNVNAGQAIKLRLRTDRYDGFRTYREVRRVLCHELTHNVWRDHDNNFKELNSQLNREVSEFERAAAEGTHYLADFGETYQPSSQLEAEAQAYILGGGTQSSSSIALDDSREEMRRRMLQAAMDRLRKEEEELEKSCGTGRPSTAAN